MIRKIIKTLGITIGIGIATITIMCKTPTMIKADDFLTVNYVNDFDVVNGYVKTDTFHWEKGQTNANYTFTIDNPSYVKCKIDSEIGAGATLGIPTVTWYYYSNIINCDGIDSYKMRPKTSITRYALLDKGTYTFKAEREDNDDASRYDGNISFQVMALPIQGEITSSNKAKKYAKNITEGKIYSNIFSNSAKKYWYKMKVNMKKKVSITTAQYNDLDVNIPAQYMSVRVYDSGSHLIAKGNIDNKYSNRNKNVFVLKKGTYYIKISGNEQYINKKIEKHDVSATCKLNIYFKGVSTDKTPPNKPAVTKYNSGTRTIWGKGEAYSKVTVIIKGKKYSGKVSSNGKFTIKADKVFKVGDKIRIYLTDASGNVSKSKYVTVKKHPIAKPTLTTCRVGVKSIKGIAKAKSTVTITINAEKYKTTSNEDKYFKVKLPFKLKKNQVIKVKVKDRWGNTSYLNVKL